MFELRVLQYFLTVAREQNITKSLYQIFRISNKKIIA